MKHLSTFDIISTIKDEYSTHEVAINKKKPKSGEPAKEKHAHHWYAKKGTHEHSAVVEVVARELSRLVNPFQMKTRLAQDEEGHYHVISKGMLGYETLDNYSESALARNIQTNRWRGLGHVLVTSLFLGEKDLKQGNLGIDRAGNILMHDRDRCFEDLTYRRSYDVPTISADAITRLPQAPMQVYNWLSFVQEGRKGHSVFDSVAWQTNPALRDEINATLLNILVLPDDLIAAFVHDCTKSYTRSPSIKEALIQKILEQKELLTIAALSDPCFTDYLNGSKKMRQQLIRYQAYLSTFCTTGKNPLSCYDEDRVADQFIALYERAKTFTPPEAQSSEARLNDLDDDEVTRLLLGTDMSSSTFSSEEDETPPESRANSVRRDDEDKEGEGEGEDGSPDQEDLGFH